MTQWTLRFVVEALAVAIVVVAFLTETIRTVQR